MALVPRLDQRQSQSLVMTPQLQQAIKLLQMSTIELPSSLPGTRTEPHAREGRGNRRDDTDAPDVLHPDEIADVTWKAPTSDLAALSDINFEAPAPTELSTDSGLDVDYENIYTSNGVSDDQSLADTPNHYAEPAFSGSAHSGGSGFDSTVPDLEQTLSELPSLRDHLTDQLTMEFADGTHG